jgi:hypothetical protein
LERNYEAWTGDRVTIDTAGQDIGQSFELLSALVSQKLRK